LLVASANLAHLLIARNAGRAREVAVRRALGARRVEIVRLLLFDGVLLSVAGGLVAWALSVWAFGAVRSLVPALIPRATRLALDARVLAGGFAFTLVVGLLAGLLPAIQLSRPSTEDLLQRGGRGASRRARLGKVLIAVEAALAVVLVAGAGLMLNSFVRLTRVDAGFQADGVLQMNVVVPSALNEAGAHDYLNRALDRLRALPFVSAVGTTDLPPLTTAGRGLTFQGGAAPANGLQGDVRTVSPGFFGTLGIRMIEGREFDAVDTGGEEPAVLAESAAKALFPDGPATGRRIRGNDHEYVVIGVAADIKNFDLKSRSARMLYLSADRHRPANVYIMARVAAGRRLDDVAGQMAREVRSVDPRAPFRSVKPLQDLVGDSLADTRLQAILFGVFGLLALAVAVAGVASVTAYGVTRRTQEFGIRLALGSRPARLVRLVVGESLLPAVIGLAVGLGAALALSRFLARMVFGITAQDPVTFVGVIAGLIAATAAASYLPARRASRLDPTVALRSE
jgi:putative ABC transport system permease protein